MQSNGSANDLQDRLDQFDDSDLSIDPEQLNVINLENH